MKVTKTREDYLEYKKQWRKDNPDKVKNHTNNHIKFIHEYKQYYFDYMGGKCMSCGLIDNPIVFDYHHVDPKIKDNNISSMIDGLTKSNKIEKIEAIENELSKCVLVCVHCHRKIHASILPCPNVLNSLGPLG